MVQTSNLSDAVLKRLRWPLRLTRAGMVAERGLGAFWPLVSVLMLALSALMFGLHVNLSLEAGWIISVLVVLTGLASLVHGLRRFRWPTFAEALGRLDATLPGRPISAITDHQAIGAGDAASVLVWQAHVVRMARRAANAKAAEPNLRIAALDPFALRYVAVLAFVMALIFGSVLRVATVGDLATGGVAYAGGPTWEGWIEPPAYTGKPSIYLADIRKDRLSVPVGSGLTLRLYGEVGALTVDETVSGRTTNIESAAEPSQSFEILHSGRLAIEGAGGRIWQIEVTADRAPTVTLSGEVERGARGDMRQTFAATDDYGVVSGQAELMLDLDAVDRRYGLAAFPEPRPVIVLDLPMPFSGERREFTEILIENLAEHPWAGLPVRVIYRVEDAVGNTGESTAQTIDLPGRRFFDPLAAALVEQRRDLLWSRENAARVAQVLRAVSYRPDGFFRSETAYLMLRVAIRRLELAQEYQFLSLEKQVEIAQALWDIAILLEDGNLADAAERLQRAQERLEQAMRDGASDEEIAELMEELRQAMQDYFQQLAEQAQENDQLADNQNTQEITGDQLQQMLDRLQELMEQGRMAEAQQLMDQLRRMMENMQITQGEGGQGQQSPGQQAMEGLADTLRQQQELNDDTFSDLQNQFSDQGQQSGDQGQQGMQGQQGQQGLNGDQGQGQQPGDGQGQEQGSQPGQGRAQGQEQGRQPGRSLADRQQGLGDLLGRQVESLPGAGTPGGDDAGDALGRAGRAMEGAEQALRQGDYPGALDDQAQALEALREGLRDMAEDLARNQQQGQQGEAFGQSDRQNSTDPLGRESGGYGQVGTDEQLLQGDDVYRRAKELLDEIRRRSSQSDRPDLERDYLKRLLDRF